MDFITIFVVIIAAFYIVNKYSKGGCSGNCKQGRLPCNCKEKIK